MAHLGRWIRVFMLLATMVISATLIGSEPKRCDWRMFAVTLGDIKLFELLNSNISEARCALDLPYM